MKPAYAVMLGEVQQRDEPNEIQKMSTLKPAPRFLPAALPGSSGRPTTLANFNNLLPVLGALVAFPLVLSDNLFLRILFAVALALLIFVNRRTCWVGSLSLFYLTILGGLRRNLIPILGEQKFDPLILVIPGFVCLCFLAAAFLGRISVRTRFQKLRLILLVVMLLEVFNPKQGGVIVGLGGMMFYIIPVLWSFISQDVADKAGMQNFFRIVVFLGLLAALYGFKQTFFGLSVGERIWMTKSGEAALYLGGDETRPFSFLTNASEYAGFLSMAIVISFVFATRLNPLWALPIPIFGIALLYTGIRGPIVISTATCIMIWAVQGRTLRSWVPRGALAVVLAVGGIAYGLRSASENLQSAAVQHSAQGLLNPSDSKKSTAGMHATMIENGVMAGFLNPIGMGLGATTMAASRLGGTGYTSEFDISNMFISLGCVGGVLWVAFVLTTLYDAFRAWHLQRSTAALCILAALFSHLGGWLNGGNYAIAMLVWFCIGSMYSRAANAESALHRIAAASVSPGSAPSRIARRHTIGEARR